MFLAPTIGTRAGRARAQKIYTKSIPAPVGGMNDRDALGAMDEKDAVILKNFWPLPSKVMLRRGSPLWVSGIGSAVESLMGYAPKTGTSALFAAAGTSFYNVTSTGTVGAAVVTSLTNARWQHVNVSNSGGNFLMAVNGADKLRGWNGSAWWADGDGTHDITGVDTATVIGITLFKRRVWFVKSASASAWYLPVDAIAGAAVELDLGPLFKRGGSLQAIANWSLDAGIGIDDYAAFISSQGEVALYKGSDPASATTWALVGVFYIGSPIGRRCAAPLGGDVMLICRDGLVPLSKALMSSRVNSQIALTDKIQNTISEKVALYASNFGWQPILYPGQDMIILNVPIGTGAQVQYAMNTITGAWAQFTGWPANCFEVFDNELYYGANGNVFKAWSGYADNGSLINAEALQAFSYFGGASALKYFTMARPILATTENLNLLYGLNVDLDTTTQPDGSPTTTAVTADLWGTGLWGTAMWGAGLVQQLNWQTMTGVGYSAAAHIKASSSTGQMEWSSTDYGFQRGGVL